jgi:lysophospholipase L1-like esterase
VTCIGFCATGFAANPDPKPVAGESGQTVAVRPKAAQPTHSADDAGFLMQGRWNVESRQATTINNGSSVEFGFTGKSCRLVFDVTKAKILPAIAVWVDGCGPTRIPIEDTGVVSIPPPSGISVPPGAKNARHAVRFLGVMDGGYLTNINNWQSLEGAVVFKGVILEPGESLFALPSSAPQIEFLGDSITAGLAMVRDRKFPGYGPEDQYPEGNWPEWTARWLGMRPVVTGFGGQGITHGGTGGVPSAPDAFGFVYQGKAWTPSSKPAVVVIYQGTNDSEIQTPQYQAFLSKVRTAYPDAFLFAVVPHDQGKHAAAIQEAVQELKDPRIFFLDYSQDVVSPADKADSCHLTPGGALRLATRLAGDIRSRIAMQPVQAAGEK